MNEAETAAAPQHPQMLRHVAIVDAAKVLGFHACATRYPMVEGSPQLLVLAAGKGTRFGQQPKCIQPVLGTPLARYSINSFREAIEGRAPRRHSAVADEDGHASTIERADVRAGPRPSSDTYSSIVIVGYRHDEVAAALGTDNLYIISDNPTGGTAYAAFEAFSVPGLIEANPIVVVTMGDRVVPKQTYQRLLDTHRAGPEAALTFLTARYQPPRHQGKGRVLRDRAGRVVRIVEQNDIAAESDPLTQQALESLTEGNCPLYAIRAATLHRHLGALTNDNAQSQFYLTDIVAAIAGEGGEVRTITTSPGEPEYDVLCSDVTRPADLAVLEGVLRQRPAGSRDEIEAAVAAIRDGRPAGQVASIARQLRELVEAAERERLGFLPDAPVAIGISGGRLRIAFMHPDMARFYGPAWQMPIGAADAQGNEQIVVLAQTADDGRIHLFPLDPKFRESQNSVAADGAGMYPGPEVSDWHTYEGFGTKMSESLLLSLGYFSDEEIAARKLKNLPLPPPSLRVSSSMRRPFALVGNALASLRTLRTGSVGAKVQAHLDRERFHGLRLACTGGIPQGGFSSSSALTVATKNALNALYGFELSPDLLVHLACQAEYGTGVRAGSLDQATEQKGRAGEGTLISSNPAENYRVLGTFPVPSDRFRVIFPYSVDRDREAWRWSWGAYAEASTPDGPLTTGEVRKMTGKAAEIAAILVRLPLDTSFFKQIEADLLATGELTPERHRWVAEVLLKLPLSATCAELRQRLRAERDWYISELIRVEGIGTEAAAKKTDATFEALFAGWREPMLARGARNQRLATRDQRPEISRDAGSLTSTNGDSGGALPHSLIPAVRPSLQSGVPLRAMVAYLFHEVAVNFHLIHHPEAWIACVSRSQRGDRSIDVDYTRLPSREEMESELDWERDVHGPARLDRWLDHFGAVPYAFNAGLDDAGLAGDSALVPFSSSANQPSASGSFFRGLALIDMVEAMLKRAFGEASVACRVNAAGQGDYFQVHVDAQRADLAEVKNFMENAYYRRFGLFAEPKFVETCAGGGAAGIRVSRSPLLRSVFKRLGPSVGSVNDA